uniref:PWWP domain containing 2B n=1 Tax=Oryctolagus cuniculus TaxID=9986 RepID=A0A5F9CWJ9_RABIT
MASDSRLRPARPPPDRAPLPPCRSTCFGGARACCRPGSGLFGLPPWAPPPPTDEPPASRCHDQAPEEGHSQAATPGAGSPPPPKSAGPEPPPPLVPPLPAGSLPPYPPYFEGAPFPHPLWLRSSYQQWVPQPPPRSIKRTRRRLSRNRDPGRLILSTIRLRPRQVLCEKCKSTLSPEQASPGPPAPPRARRRLGSGPDQEQRRPEGPGDSEPSAPATPRRSKRERLEEARPPGGQVPRSPVIRISYSTPQGKGESGQRSPPGCTGSRGASFCPPWSRRTAAPTPSSPGRRAQCWRGTSCPKLKLTRQGTRPGTCHPHKNPPAAPPGKLASVGPCTGRKLVGALDSQQRGPRARLAHSLCRWLCPRAGGPVFGKLGRGRRLPGLPPGPAGPRGPGLPGQLPSGHRGLRQRVRLQQRQPGRVQVVQLRGDFSRYGRPVVGRRGPPAFLFQSCGPDGAAADGQAAHAERVQVRH